MAETKKVQLDLTVSKIVSLFNGEILEKEDCEKLLSQFDKKELIEELLNDDLGYEDEDEDEEERDVDKIADQVRMEYQAEKEDEEDDLDEDEEDEEDKEEDDLDVLEL